jgi:hypothetical protein
MIKNAGKSIDGIDYLNTIKKERSYKLKTINSIELVREELEKLKLKYELCSELFIVTTKNKEFSIQVDCDLIMYFTNISEDRRFHLCKYGLDVEKFVMQLEDIVDNVDKIYKLKAEIDKKSAK